MSATFKVGEVAILCGLVKQPQFNGCEVTITTPCRYGHHGIHLPGAHWSLVRKVNLRKKPSPRSTRNAQKLAKAGA